VLGPGVFPSLSTMDAVTAAIVAPSVVGLLWSVKEYKAVAAVDMDGHEKARGVLAGLEQKLLHPFGDSDKKSLEDIKHIGKLISDGANTFLMQEYRAMLVFIVLFGGFVAGFVGPTSSVAFVVGAVTSILAGWIGMKIAVFTNTRTTHECWAPENGVTRGYAVAIRGGCVMGFSLVSLGLLNLFILIKLFISSGAFGSESVDWKVLTEALAGYGLGGSSIALFGRVGGGIYTKAADVGADLSGKIEQGLDEDDKRNPACIADNVGDNVGDIAGMGADLFGSFAESTCACLVIAGASGTAGIANDWNAMMFPLLISAGGIVAGIVTMIIVDVFYKVKVIADVEKGLKGILNISTVVVTPIIWLLAVWVLPPSFIIAEGIPAVSPLHACVPIWMGLWSGLLIGYTTEYYTSHSYTPVREIASTQAVSAATGIIYGLAVGYLSCIIPVFALACTILVAHSLCGMYGCALAALGMLSTMTMGLTIDAYGPISDNAGGIAEMSELGEDIRKITDALDAAGNTTAAIGKGFAIGSAALVSLALFGAFTVRAEISRVEVLNPWTFTGLLMGAMLPYWFSAMTMKSVGHAADAMVQECRVQFPKIMREGAEPDYAKCIGIATDASLREMIMPGVLVMGSPLIAGFCFGKNCTAGLLSGALVSGVQMAISMSNTGGAWDNAKKYIEASGAKGSEQHKNAVTGDTVGDPLKDTSGPALNILVKLSAIISLVFGGVIAQTSNEVGGPYWLPVPKA